MAETVRGTHRSRPTWRNNEGSSTASKVLESVTGTPRRGYSGSKDRRTAHARAADPFAGGRGGREPSLEPKRQSDDGRDHRRALQPARPPARRACRHRDLRHHRAARARRRRQSRADTNTPTFTFKEVSAGSDDRM